MSERPTVRDVLARLRQRQAELGEAIAAWVEDAPQVLNNNWFATLADRESALRQRVQNAADALTRSADEVDSINMSFDRESLRRITNMARTSQTLNDMSNERLPWLVSAVDTVVQAVNSQGGNISLHDPNSENEHVVLLHGLGRSNLSLLFAERSLATRGYNVTNVNYPSLRGPIEELAPAAIAPALARVSAENGQRVHFVTHSMGGILVRYFAKAHGIPDLGRVVMLSPPNKGTEIVDNLRNLTLFRTFQGPAALQLGTDENSITRQLGDVDFELGVITGNRSIEPLLSSMIPGPNDGKVSVESAQVDGMSDFLVLPYTHTFIMQSQAVIDQVIFFLQNGSFDHSAVSSQ